MIHWLLIYAASVAIAAWLMEPPRWRAFAWLVVLLVYLHRGGKAARG